MKFSLLLFGLHFLLKRASKKNSPFKHYIRKSKVKILIKTADGKRARLFIFNKGNVDSIKCDQEDFDVALIWRNPAIGFKAMTDKNPKASFNAAAEDGLKVEGMSLYAQWFDNGIKLVL